MRGEFSVWHLLILAGVFVLLFGAKRLPDAARSIGKSLRIFKTEVKGLHDDDPPAPTPAPVGQLPASPAEPAPPQPHVEPERPTTVAGERSESI
jgi:sec-independent protein translocase protein TatA